MEPAEKTFKIIACSKVPEITFFFWLIKMMSTTVGETAADFLNAELGLGLAGIAAVIGGMLALVLYVQVKARSYIPWHYWLAVVLVSIFGTLVTDILTDQLAIPLLLSCAMFGSTLILTFMIWHRTEGTLSIHAINTPSRELFYWTAILFTFALGTAVGDFVSESWAMGYLSSALLFGALIAVTILAFYGLKAPAGWCFWIAYVLTRPFGASWGDLLSQPVDNGGLGLGSMTTSSLFLSAILILVIYLSFNERRPHRQ
ncbi:hypothetical protein ABK905_16975 [Acerihabitans sp. KWT182]|uniref:Membrane-anchored protein n=1 Tax=Acerihabitans sp. KWT182 TaxID=3157919 RepID=A0AAU7Q6P4_9GAMM